jgi:endonuclease-3 related protein
MAHPADGTRLQAIFEQLLSAYGAQHWWPADSPFEVMVGAVLTQNSAWSNVEKAIENLHQAHLLGLQPMLDAPVDVLAEQLRPAGCFNIKARRLQQLCAFIDRSGGIVALGQLSTPELRSALLAVHGTGPETADDILLYAYQRPVFVIDAYTRRIFSRIGSISGEEKYEELRQLFESSLSPNVEQFNEYHALIVRHAKVHCAPRPLCGACVLRLCCDFQYN